MGKKATTLAHGNSSHVTTGTANQRLHNDLGLQAADVWILCQLLRRMKCPFFGFLIFVLAFIWWNKGEAAGVWLRNWWLSFEQSSVVVCVSFVPLLPTDMNMKRHQTRKRRAVRLSHVKQMTFHCFLYLLWTMFFLLSPGYISHTKGWNKLI